MRTWLLLFLLGAGVLSADVAVVDAGGDRSVAAWKKGPVKVAFWNVEWFPGKSPKPPAGGVEKHIRAAAAEVRAASPDILFAEEIGNRRAMEKLAPGRAFYYCTSIPRAADENPGLPNQGLGLASRLMPRRVWVLDFSGLAQTPDRPVRGILGAEFALNSGKLVVYALHLKSNRGYAAGNRARRQRAVDLLQEDWRRMGFDPAKDRILVGGDFNTSLDDPQFDGERTLSKLAGVGFVNGAVGLPRHRAFTVSGDSRFPPNNFDHIFVSLAQARLFPDPPPWTKVRRFVPAASDHAMLEIGIP